MDPFLATAIDAAEAAARVHLRHFGEVGVGNAREKGRSDFVSRVDLEAQEEAVALIRNRFPGHRILAEEEDESGRERGESGTEASGPPEGAGLIGERRWPGDGTPLWIIDPLDGTTNYLHGHPMFAASVAVGRAPGGSGGGGAGGGILEAGAVVAPRTGERWWARRGGGAWKNGLPLGVSRLRSMRSALIGTGFPFKEPELVPRYLAELGRVLPASGGVRRGGAAALDLCYLAEGILDGFWEESYLSPWDVAAGLLILREAGGMATRLDGGEVDLEVGSLLATNSRELWAELGRAVRGEG